MTSYTPAPPLHLLTSLHGKIHDFLWLYNAEDWDQEAEAALSFLDANVKVTATDKTLRKILSSDEGVRSIKSLGWMMFGGLEDGAVIVPEPLLEENIVCDAESEMVGRFDCVGWGDALAFPFETHGFTSQALITLQFAIKPPSRPKQWNVRHTRAFDGLDQVLQELDKELEKSQPETAELDETVTQSKAAGNAKRRRKAKKRRRKNPTPNKNRALMNFIKAARYVRGLGAGKIHPSAKLKLYGLLMQAKFGNAPLREDDVRTVEENSGVKRSFERLKLDAWRAQKDKDRKAAMEEHVALLTSLAPQWRVESTLGSRKWLLCFTDSRAECTYDPCPTHATLQMTRQKQKPQSVWCGSSE